MADHTRLHRVDSGDFYDVRPGDYATHVAVPVNQYAALIRARDILSDPDQLADDIVAIAVEHFADPADFVYGDPTAYRTAVVECLGRSASGPSDGGAMDDRPVQH